jgi:hypothetical protein
VADQADERPVWAERIRQERVTRRWSQAEAVRALRAHAPVDRPSDASLLRSWTRWETGADEPGPADQALLAKIFGTVTAALFPVARTTIAPTPAAEATRASTLEVLSRLRSRSIDDPTLTALAFKVNDLCSKYARAPSGPLLVEGRKWLGRLTQILDRRLSLDQHREVLRRAGFLALLVGCLEYDQGFTANAEANRLLAASLGSESGSADVVGWAFELRAWQALTQGDFRTVISVAEAGRAVAPKQGASVQLAAQTARAWARIGQRREVEVALDGARNLLESLPIAENPDNHFVVDPFRFDLWAMDCYRVLGENRLAAGLAREVLRNGTDVDGRERSPMRNAEAHVTLGVVAARSGDVEAAVHEGKLALSGDRKCLPGLLVASRELAYLLDRDFQGVPQAEAYTQEVRQLERQVLRWGDPARRPPLHDR